MHFKIALQDSKTLILQIPSPTSNRTRSLVIPLSIDGLKLIRKTLQHQEYDTDTRLGTPASPTQEQVNAWLAANKTAKAAKHPAIVKEVIKEKYNLDLSDLDLTL